jgi:hypothetical protein
MRRNVTFGVERRDGAFAELNCRHVPKVEARHIQSPCRQFL